MGPFGRGVYDNKSSPAGQARCAYIRLLLFSELFQKRISGVDIPCSKYDRTENIKFTKYGKNSRVVQCYNNIVTFYWKDLKMPFNNDNRIQNL